jgi:hypothetical protein
MHDDTQVEPASQRRPSAPPRSQRRPRSGFARDLRGLDDVGEDFGLVCHQCATVTIFSSGAAHPRCCSRCAAVLDAS